MFFHRTTKLGTHLLWRQWTVFSVWKAVHITAFNKLYWRIITKKLIWKKKNNTWYRYPVSYWPEAKYSVAILTAETHDGPTTFSLATVTVPLNQAMIWSPWKEYTKVNKILGLFKDVVPDDVWKQLILITATCHPVDLHEAFEVSGETGSLCKKNKTLNESSD